MRKTTNKPVGRRTIRVIGDDWILSVAPEEAASIRRMIWRAFSGTAQRCFLKHEWRVKGWPSNAAKLMDFAKRHGFAVSDGARWLADKLQQKEQLGQSGRAGAPPARTISEGRDRKGRLSYLIRFGSKDTEPDFAAIHARVKELPGAHYLFRKGQAWAVEAQYQAEVVAFAEEFKFTLPAALAAGAEQGGPNEASGI